jgi:hypothetical protein
VPRSIVPHAMSYVSAASTGSKKPRIASSSTPNPSATIRSGASKGERDQRL